MTIFHCISKHSIYVLTKTLFVLTFFTSIPSLLPDLGPSLYILLPTLLGFLRNENKLLTRDILVSPLYLERKRNCALIPGFMQVAARMFPGKHPFLGRD